MTAPGVWHKETASGLVAAGVDATGNLHIHVSEKCYTNDDLVAALAAEREAGRKEEEKKLKELVAKVVEIQEKQYEMIESRARSYIAAERNRCAAWHDAREKEWRHNAEARQSNYLLAKARADMHSNSAAAIRALGDER